MLTHIFSILWENGLINADVLSQDEFDVWSLYTFIPYQRDCTKLDRHRIASFPTLNFTKTTNFSMKQLYPDKLKNFNQCKLFIAAVPSGFYVQHSTANEIDHYSGIDINIIKQISKTLNFQIVYKHIDQHGEVLENGTLTGSMSLVRICIKNIRQQSYDIFIYIF